MYVPVMFVCVLYQNNCSFRCLDVVDCFLSFFFPSSNHSTCVISISFPPLFASCLFLLILPSSSVLPHSQPSSCSPSPALSMESLSSGSDHSSSQPPLGGGANSDQEHPFTKSSSEPSINRQCDSAASPNYSSAERLPHLTPTPSTPPKPSNISSAPSTPQTSRSSGTKGAPPPRPSTTPSPLASGPPPSLKKVIKHPKNREVVATFAHYI